MNNPFIALTAKAERTAWTDFGSYLYNPHLLKQCLKRKYAYFYSLLEISIFILPFRSIRNHFLKIEVQNGKLLIHRPES